MQDSEQQAPQSRIRDQALPGLLTASYDTAVALDNNGGLLDAAGIKAYKRVEMFIADPAKGVYRYRTRMSI